MWRVAANTARTAPVFNVSTKIIKYAFMPSCCTPKHKVFNVILALLPTKV